MPTADSLLGHSQMQSTRVDQKDSLIAEVHEYKTRWLTTKRVCVPRTSVNAV